MNDAQVIGIDPDIPFTVFEAFLREQRSPALSAAQAVYDYCVRRRVSPAFLLAMFEHESQCGNRGTAAQTHSWGNTRLPNFGVPYQGPTVAGRSGEFPVFHDWIDGGISTVARSLDYAPYQGKTTVRQIIPVWAPSTDQNNPDRYANAVLARMVDLRGRAAVTLPTPAPGGTMLPKPPMVSNPAANRDGYSDPINKQAIVWHITDGTNSLGWLTGTASGVSANYLIDRDSTIHELVPWTQAAWVQGISEAPDTSNPLIADWVARGVNFNTVATGIECEGKSLCGQPGSLTAPQAGSLIALTAWLCQEQGHPCDRTHIIRHAQLQRYGRACCPGYDEKTEMLPWIDQAARLLAGTTTLPGGTMSTEDQNRQLLLAKVEQDVPVQYRGALTREGRFDASAFGGSANERVAVYEKLRCHTLSGSVVAFALAGDTSYDALVAAGKVQLY